MGLMIYFYVLQHGAQWLALPVWNKNKCNTCALELLGWRIARWCVYSLASFPFPNSHLLFSVCGHLALLSWLASVWELTRSRSEVLQMTYFALFVSWPQSVFFSLCPADREMHAVHHKGEQARRGRFLELEGP